jgi:hypothetical protein
MVAPLFLPCPQSTSQRAINNQPVADRRVLAAADFIPATAIT